MSKFYDFEAEDVMCNMHKMEEYQGKVVLIVNTATRCGFTPQYDDLQNLYEKYQEQGFEILDFPCNQFGNQAPGTNEEIVSFCDAKFGITFKHYAKIDVNGADIKWNFTKFLIDRNGNVVERFEPTADMDVVEEKIREIL
jgi:glutathione peroxidase